jgi:KDO2-lipid IV(A) lauroyltransferase
MRALLQESFYRRASAAIACLPEPCLARLASVLAWVLYRGLHVRRSVVRRNLAIAFPAAPVATREVTALASFRSCILTALETIGAGARDASGSVDLLGREHLDEALAQGRGCLVLCIHTGNWETLAGAVSRKVAPTHVVVKRIRNGPLDSYLAWLRAKLGYVAIPSDDGSGVYRRIARALRANEIVGFVLDQYQPGAPALPCFGVTTKTNTGLATIWRRTGTPVVPIVIERKSPYRHVATIWPALRLERTTDAGRDILAATAHFNHVMERMILCCPEQYFWLHDRWKWKRRETQATRPERATSTGRAVVPVS